LKIFIELVISG